jgi:predicted transposase YbfD/YdcC
MEDFVCANEAWRRGFLELPNDIPMHDTLNDLIGRINRDAFAQAFWAWVQTGLPELAGHQVTIDGKRLCGSRGVGGTIHVISAFARRRGWSWRHKRYRTKPTKLPPCRVCSALNLAGAVVTIDAMGCQRDIARIIGEQRADHVLALKDNHPTLHDDVKLWLDDNAAQEHVRMHQTKQWAGAQSKFHEIGNINTIPAHGG